MNAIITISRRHGSRGQEIGGLLAERLGIPMYDRQSLKQAVRDMGLEAAIKEAYAGNSDSILYQLAMNSYSFGYHDTAGSKLIAQRAPTVAFDAIRKIAKQGPCVIVGRCADYVLRDFPNVVSVFIHAPMSARVGAVAAGQGLDSARAEERIRSTDRLRGSYYNYYTDRNWGEADSYNFSVDSSILGVGGTAGLLEALVREREKLTAMGA